MGRHEDPSRPPNHLRAWREFRNLTQAQLAAMIDTEGSVISLLESGDRGLSDKWLRRLAPALATTPGLLLDFDPQDSDQAVLELWGRIPEAHKPALRTRFIQEEETARGRQTQAKPQGKLVKLRVPSRQDEDEEPKSERNKKP